MLQSTVQGAPMQHRACYCTIMLPDLYNLKRIQVVACYIFRSLAKSYAYLAILNFMSHVDNSQ